MEGPSSALAAMARRCMSVRRASPQEAPVPGYLQSAQAAPAKTGSGSGLVSGAGRCGLGCGGSVLGVGAGCWLVLRPKRL